MDLPSTENLRCFVAAAQSLNFRAAARSVALTPAAFGARIKQLEDQLGASLFHRTTRSVTLTTEGLALLSHARQVLAMAADCARVAKGGVGAAPMELTVGTRHELGLSWLVPQLDELSRRFEHLTLHLYFSAGDDLLVRLRSRELDCAVTSTRLADPRLDAVQLHEERYALVGAKALLAKTPFRRRSQSEAHTLIDAGHDLPLFRYWRDAPGAGEGLRFARVWRLGTIEAIAWAVRAGRGVAVLPRYLIEKDLAKGALVPLLPSVTPTTDHFRLVFRADDPRRSFYVSLAQALCEHPLR